MRNFWFAPLLIIETSNVYEYGCNSHLKNLNLQVLELDPRNEKALYRRGQANYALKNYDDALMDLKQADKVSPNNRAVHKLLDEVRITNKSYNEIQKQRLSKFFRDQKEAEAFFEIANNWTKTDCSYT